MRVNFTWRDLFASVFVVLFVSGIVIAERVRTLDMDNKIICASNLRQIAIAILQYANENKGNYPRAIYEHGDDPKPVWGTPYANDDKLEAPLAISDLGGKIDPFAPDGQPQTKFRPGPNDITASMFLLIRTEQIVPDVFVCPGTSLKDYWDFGGSNRTSLQWTNWNGIEGLREHLSYSMTNNYFSKKAVANGVKLNISTGENFAIFGDLNPGVSALLTVSADSPADQLQRCLSFNHNQSGQNILYGDGHVELLTTPFCGSHKDNVYTFGGSGQHPGGDGIVGSPTDADDSVLLPTAKDLGCLDANEKPLISPEIAIATPDMAADIKKKIAGSYRPESNDASKALSIDDNSIVVKSDDGTENYKYEVVGQSVKLIYIRMMNGDKARVRRFTITDGGISIERLCKAGGDWKKSS